MKPQINCDYDAAGVTITVTSLVSVPGHWQEYQAVRRRVVTATEFNSVSQKEKLVNDTIAYLKTMLTTDISEYIKRRSASNLHQQLD